MKKNVLKWLLPLFCVAAVSILGCKIASGDSDDNGGGGGKETVELKICVLGIPSTNKKPGVWAWAKASSDINYTSASWPGDLAMEKGKEGGYDCYTYTLKVDPNYDLGILFNNIAGADGKPKTGDIVIPKAKFLTAK